MQFAAVLNRDGGTLRTIDLAAFEARLKATLEAAGHSVDVVVVSGKGLIAALDKAAVGNADVVLAGGGDGTISAAAARLMSTKKALAVLPAGTMNLFARSLNIPLALDQAVLSFATGTIKTVDVATANGRPFIHQFSIGMHAKMVKLRSKMEFGSRFGKMRASAKAAWNAAMAPPAMHVTLTIGEAEFATKTTGVGITNNLFTEGRVLPYAEFPDGGVLGIYVSVAEQRGEMIRFLFNMARGRWRTNQHVDVHQGDRVTLKLKPKRGKAHAVIDGELVPLTAETVLQIHPGALKVLVPASESAT